MLVLAAMSNEILHGAIAYKLYIYHINLKPKKKINKTEKNIF